MMRTGSKLDRGRDIEHVGGIFFLIYKLDAVTASRIYAVNFFLMFGKFSVITSLSRHSIPFSTCVYLLILILLLNECAISLRVSSCFSKSCFSFL